MNAGPDGVYTLENDKPRFNRARAPSQSELERLLATVRCRVMKIVENVADRIDFGIVRS